MEKQEYKEDRVYICINEATTETPPSVDKRASSPTTM